ncbi:unnamed protein product [Schistocephalus solidus]|uniref:GRIP domain-containing protein n=1 Tax=Schistocephalus solidus TaxID=70667 RepID=A0A183T5Y7_SCHSO|nr:unnamed protein product [Schistocephalus solidus]
MLDLGPLSWRRKPLLLSRKCDWPLLSIGAVSDTALTKVEAFIGACAPWRGGQHVCSKPSLMRICVAGAREALTFQASLDLTCCNLRSQLNSATAEVSSQKSAADKQITELHLQLCNAKSKLFTSNSIQQQQQQQHQQQQQQMPSSKELLRLQNIMMAMSNENQYLKSHVEQMKEELRQVRQTSNLQQQEIQLVLRIIYPMCSWWFNPSLNLLRLGAVHAVAALFDVTECENGEVL